MKILMEEEVIECRDEAARMGYANSSFQKVLDAGHEIYRQGWTPVYIMSDNDSAMMVNRAAPDMTRAN